MEKAYSGACLQFSALWTPPRCWFRGCALGTLTSGPKSVNSATSPPYVTSGMAEHAQAAGDRPFSARRGAGRSRGGPASPGKEAQPGTNHRRKRAMLCFRATLEAHIIACSAKRGGLGRVHARNALTHAHSRHARCISADLAGMRRYAAQHYRGGGSEAWLTLREAGRGERCSGDLTMGAHGSCKRLGGTGSPCTRRQSVMGRLVAQGFIEQHQTLRPAQTTGYGISFRAVCVLLWGVHESKRNQMHTSAAALPSPSLVHHHEVVLHV